MNRIYSFSDQRVIAAGGNALQAFDLINIEPDKKIISLLWELRIEDNITNAKIPLEQLTTQNYWLVINNAPSNISDVFQNFTDLPAIVWNGTGFVIETPNKQIMFKSCSLQNITNFTIGMYNYDALLSYHYYNTILIETE